MPAGIMLSLSRDFFKHVSKNAQICYRYIGKRYFLSQAYSCQEVWDKRLEDPILKSVKIDTYYYELDRKFVSNKTVSAVDIDVFANKITNSDQLDDLEELIHRFRRTPNTIHCLESTSHAVIRAYLYCKEYDGLIRILNDRVNYGIFPDYFTFNLMMNTFLFEKNYRDAAKVATFLMLQEEFDNQLSNSLALYSCHMYLEHSEHQLWDQDAEAESKEEEDTEETWVRVDFIPEPYFDDHFDLTDPLHLIGKTLVQLGKKSDDVVGKSYELLGWILFQKWNQVITCLQKCLESKEKMIIFKDIIDKAEKALSLVTDDESKKVIQEKIEPVMKQLKQSEKINDENPTKILEERIRSNVAAQEAKDIDDISRKYADWIQNRNKKIETQIETYLKQEKLQKIKEKLNKLKKEEELLFFFENIEKHRLNIPPEEEDKMINEKGKISGKSLLDVPPEIEDKVGRYSSGIIEQHEPWWRWKENPTQDEPDKK